MNAQSPQFPSIRNAEPVLASARKIELVVVHCSATPDDRTLFYGTPGTRDLRTPADEIDVWHFQRGFRRDVKARAAFNPHFQAIGYHFVIARNGALLTGRHPDEIGAHVKGWNANSIGICLVGKERYTGAQWAALAVLVRELCEANCVPKRFATAISRVGVCGHRDLSRDKNGDGRIKPDEYIKLCPGFNVEDWLQGDLQPLAGHVAPEVSK